MRTKRVAVVSLITFLLGGVGGGAYAYVTHSAGDGQLALPDLEQAQEKWAVEQFIDQQEELRPDGLEQARIETGSKYEGITYNNTGTNAVDTSAPSDAVDETTVPDPQTTTEPEEESEEHGNLISNLLGKQIAAEEEPATPEPTMGRVAVQQGSLNIRAQGDGNSTVIGQVYKGDTVQIIGQSGGWYQIVTSDGMQGYVSVTYVETVTE